MDYCTRCGRVLTADEIALHKKLFNRGAKEFICITCCAEHFEVSEELLREKIKQYKEMGCTLFPENQVQPRA